MEESPPITADQPLSRQYERETSTTMAGRLTGPGLHFGAPFPILSIMLRFQREACPSPLEPGDDSVDPHLRSVKEITGYHIQARDGEIGHVDDVVLEDKSWVIRYLVVDTGKWLPGQKGPGCSAVD